MQAALFPMPRPVIAPDFWLHRGGIPGLFFERAKERAGRPLSPNTCTNRSVQPLITSGCSPNSGTALTMPSTFSTVSMRSSEPAAARMLASRFSPHSRAAS